MADENKKAITKEELFNILDDFGLNSEKSAGYFNGITFIKIVNTKTTRLSNAYKVEVEYICQINSATNGENNTQLKVPVTVIAYKSLSNIPTPLSTDQTIDVTVDLSKASYDGNTEEKTTLNVYHSIKTHEDGYKYLEFQCTPQSISEGYYEGTAITWSGVVDIPF